MTFKRFHNYNQQPIIKKSIFLYFQIRCLPIIYKQDIEDEVKNLKTFFFFKFDKQNSLTNETSTLLVLLPWLFCKPIDNACSAAWHGRSRTSLWREPVQLIILVNVTHRRVWQSALPQIMTLEGDNNWMKKTINRYEIFSKSLFNNYYSQKNASAFILYFQSVKSTRI